MNVQDQQRFEGFDSGKGESILTFECECVRVRSDLKALMVVSVRDWKKRLYSKMFEAMRYGRCSERIWKENIRFESFLLH